MKRNIVTWIWPNSHGRCILLALGLCPILAMGSQVMTFGESHLMGNTDFTLAIINVIAPFCFIHGFLLWFRSFILRLNSNYLWAILLGILTLPIWYLVMLAATFLIVPIRFAS
jgi:hypothetical protein